MTPERFVTADPGYSRRWLILAVVGVAQVIVGLDATVVNIALPAAQRALHSSNRNRQWVVTAYALAFGSLLPGAPNERRPDHRAALGREASAVLLRPLIRTV